MIICGVKLTHDAAVAVIEDGRLVFSFELEKLNNNKRYSELHDVTLLPELLHMHGYQMSDIDSFVLDGWHGTGQHWRGAPVIANKSGGHEILFNVAGYNELSLHEDILERKHFERMLPIGDTAYSYASYMHVAGHVLGTYCASPFAKRNESAYVLVWDGGQYPRLYHVDPERRKVESKGHLFTFLGTIYAIMGHYFGPYKRTAEQLEEDRRKQDLEGYFGGYSIAGKIMSYIALGKVQPELLAELPKIHKREIEIANTFEHKYARAVHQYVAGKGYSDADVLLTQHTYLQELLVSGLRKKIEKSGLPPQNLCFSGGSALNIKWNSAIRSSGLFRDTWVPPFPNDSGSAIGAACCEMVTRDGRMALDWSVYSGPEIIVNQPAPGWSSEPCTVEQLAELLVKEGEPVVFLNGAAELGPRALGNRSIVAPATHPNMKDILNRAKRREPFRPVAPICMQEHAPEVFDPGGHDPYMLFDHHVRERWKSVVPAICHLDGTARLQTVNAQENPVMYRLLEEYRRLTGIPLLCNTSANLNGSGFFPDIASATGWGCVNYVWCQGTLYKKSERVSLS